MNKIRMNPDTHIYEVDGKVKVSVTQALDYHDMRTDLSKVDADVLDKACEKGKRVHSACVDVAKGEHTGKVYPVEDFFYMNAFALFYEKYCKELILAEKPLYHDSLDYCGTPDMVVKLRDGRTALIEIKTCSVMPNDIYYQMLGYSHLLRRNKIKIDVLIGLRLTKDGTVDVRRSFDVPGTLRDNRWPQLMLGYHNNQIPLWVQEWTALTGVLKLDPMNKLNIPLNLQKLVKKDDPRFEIIDKISHLQESVDKYSKLKRELAKLDKLPAGSIQITTNRYVKVMESEGTKKVIKPSAQMMLDTYYPDGYQMEVPTTSRKTYYKEVDKL